MLETTSSFWVALLFGVTAAVLTWAGTRLARDGAILAHRTGLGQAVFGAAFIGAVTSLSGIVVSVSAAASGHPALALGNALGGIAAQTVFLALADLFHREANLEHAAASPTSMLQSGVLLVLLALPLVASKWSADMGLWFHPMSIVSLLTYLWSLRLSSKVSRSPSWFPEETPETRREDAPSSSDHPPEPSSSVSTPKLWTRFALLAVVLAGCGFVVGETGVALASRTGLEETAVGTFVTAVSTSLPELVTAVAAVRAGALALAVGDILGGNAFDTVLISLSDFASSESIYSALDDGHFAAIGLGQILTGLVLLGLIRRQTHGFANIGFESWACIGVYALGAKVLFSG